jgi:hypothetical protein
MGQHYCCHAALLCFTAATLLYFKWVSITAATLLYFAVQHSKANILQEHLNTPALNMISI